MPEKFLIYATEALALAASHNAYRGVTPGWSSETHKTRYLVGTVKPKSGVDLRRALRIGVADQGKFSAAQQAAMVDATGLNSGSWNV